MSETYYFVLCMLCLLPSRSEVAAKRPHTYTVTTLMWVTARYAHPAWRTPLQVRVYYYQYLHPCNSSLLEFLAAKLPLGVLNIRCNQYVYSGNNTP